MMMIYSAAVLATVLAHGMLPSSVSGHGYMTEPASRNAFARTSGTWGSQAGVPKVETTPHGLNWNYGVCGKEGSRIDYDDWLDSQGNPMPWISQTTYNMGDVIQVDMKITAHHYGHFTIGACPMGRASTQACFDANQLEFVEDLKTGMPKDDNHPNRAMLYGDGSDLSYRFKLPDGLAGEQVLLQWVYWTANNCNYDGYQEYFTTQSTPPAAKGNWNPVLGNCGPIENIPFIREGTVIAELFFNCAEVTIAGESTPTPPLPPQPVASPTARPTLRGTAVPTNAPVLPVTSPPVASPTNAPVVPVTSPPTNAPVSAPQQPAPVDPVVPAPEGGTCTMRPGMNAGVSDSACARCADGYKWWPCNDSRILCVGDACSNSPNWKGA